MITIAGRCRKCGNGKEDGGCNEEEVRQEHVARGKPGEQTHQTCIFISLARLDDRRILKAGSEHPILARLVQLRIVLFRPSHLSLSPVLIYLLLSKPASTHLPCSVLNPGQLQAISSSDYLRVLGVCSSLPSVF